MTFVDTGAWLALLHARDQHHARALAHWRQLVKGRTPLLTSSLVLAETTTLLARRVGYAYAAAQGRAILGAPNIRTLRADAIDDSAGLDRMTKWADQGITFCDCVSFQLMERHRIQVVFGFDQHFTRAGFRLEPSG